MPRSSITLVLLFSVASSATAFADFYIVKDTVTKTCTIVENNPANGVDGVAYKTKPDAEKAMQSAKGCGGTASE